MRAARTAHELVSALLLGLLVSGCGSSPPTRFYALDAVAAPDKPVAAPDKPVAAQDKPAAAPDTPLKVAAVHVPPALDRNEIVRGESHNELAISAQDRWAADFGEMARRVLTQDLQSRLPPEAVIAPDSPAPPDARGLVVDILTFQPQADGELVLSADWSLLQGAPPRPVLQRSVRLTAPAADSAGGEAAGMSQLLAQLADDIAAQVVAHPAARAR